MSRSYSQRKPEEYNLFRTFFNYITCNLVYGLYYKIACNLKVIGRENVPKKGFFIVASNHVSAVDPFLVVHAVKRPIAYMAKKELFENKIGRFFLNLLGAFAVNRDKLEVSTMKTAIGIKNTNWVLGLFPQGTRQTDGSLDNISRGFTALAKITKAPILPVFIQGALKDERHPFKSHMRIIIGKPIEYTDPDTMEKAWVDEMKKLSSEEHTSDKKKEKLNYKNYTKIEPKDFNFLTRLYQIYALRIVFIPFLVFPFYKFKITGNRNLLKDEACIAAANHISYFDPFIVSWAVNRKLAFMAKKELFESSSYLATRIRWLGGFAVNREKLEVSTIKTAIGAIKKGWGLCIFPQGGIRKNKKIEEINEGFANIAKRTKVNILPISISGLEQYNWNIFKPKKVEVKVGEPISYELPNDEIVRLWREQIASMSGYELL